MPTFEVQPTELFEGLWCRRSVAEPRRVAFAAAADISQSPHPPLSLTPGSNTAARLTLSTCGKVSAAVGNSRVAIFMIDAREGVTPLDKHFALWARRQLGHSDRQWIILVNKAEGLMSRGEDSDDDAMRELAQEVSS